MAKFGQIFQSREMGLNLKEVVARLNTFAPLSLAASWDNVGLLVEPSGFFLKVFYSVADP
jgi:putative NIF3 family GTP cyclohydrolase 1 type 2